MFESPIRSKKLSHINEACPEKEASGQKDTKRIADMFSNNDPLSSDKSETFGVDFQPVSLLA